MTRGQGGNTGRKRTGPPAWARILKPGVPVPPTSSRLIVKRNGREITGQVPKPVILVDSREQLPYSFDRHRNWIAGERVVALPTGDYSIETMSDLVAVERKSLTDLVATLMHSRERFIRECERLAEYRYRWILVEADYATLKSPYESEHIQAHPNGIVGSLDALEVKYQIPVIFASGNRALATEKLASLLSKTFTYHWLQEAGLGRVLQEGDL